MNGTRGAMLGTLISCGLKKRKAIMTEVINGHDFEKNKREQRAKNGACQH